MQIPTYQYDHMTHVEERCKRFYFASVYFKWYIVDYLHFQVILLHSISLLMLFKKIQLLNVRLLLL